MAKRRKNSILIEIIITGIMLVVFISAMGVLVPYIISGDLPIFMIVFCIVTLLCSAIIVGFTIFRILETKWKRTI